ncbi:MAG: tRNA preQ1(34) S-adenosylmethionine ribosyltransferase-isomerase QueA [Burkholderiales bacterium]|nr:tRNA preQ1(34) S-adenosylmethionine ribosyltransferase-isomerase QueA [Phycisphaerae bacterium]
MAADHARSTAGPHRSGSTACARYYATRHATRLPAQRQRRFDPPHNPAVNTSDLDFHLPPELIAQEPASERAASRLLHYRRDNRAIAHRQFSELPSLLRAGDLLVFNDARVVPARFTLIKPTGGRVEGLFLSQTQPKQWNVLLKKVGPYTAETIYEFDTSAPAPKVRIVNSVGDGQFVLDVDTEEDAISFFERIGRMPLPPYIRRDKLHDARDAADRERYQTVYAQASGSVAAPTAGLHFDDVLLRRLDDRGVERAFVTLHVGLGTFRPVSAETLEHHTMHVERYSIDANCAAALNKAKQENRRVIAVGTTSARVLESQPQGPIAPTDGETGIFIYPPYEFKHVDALITNFHLPRSTLIALVAALVGLDEQRRIYAEAIEQKYRFFSYGDASFLE